MMSEKKDDQDESCQKVASAKQQQQQQQQQQQALQEWEYSVVIPNCGASPSFAVQETPEGETAFWKYLPLPDKSPSLAEQCRLIRHSGDVLVQINGVSTQGKTFHQVLKALIESTNRGAVSWLVFRDSQHYVVRRNALEELLRKQKREMEHHHQRMEHHQQQLAKEEQHFALAHDKYASTAKALEQLRQEELQRQIDKVAKLQAELVKTSPEKAVKGAISSSSCASCQKEAPTSSAQSQPPHSRPPIEYVTTVPLKKKKEDCKLESARVMIKHEMVEDCNKEASGKQSLTSNTQESLAVAQLRATADDGNASTARKKTSDDQPTEKSQRESQPILAGKNHICNNDIGNSDMEDSTVSDMEDPGETTDVPVPSTTSSSSRRISDETAQAAPRRPTSKPFEFYKTYLCKHFLSGECPFGDRCNFAHGESDLRYFLRRREEKGAEGGKELSETTSNSTLKRPIASSSYASLPKENNRSDLLPPLKTPRKCVASTPHSTQNSDVVPDTIQSGELTKPLHKLDSPLSSTRRKGGHGSFWSKNRDCDDSSTSFSSYSNSATELETKCKYWGPPTAAGKNRRVIDGKPMYWKVGARRWVVDKYPPKQQHSTMNAEKFKRSWEYDDGMV